MPKRRGHGLGALYKIEARGRTYWRGVIDLGTHPATGRRMQRSVQARTQREARDKLEALQREVAEHGAPLDRTVTVETWSHRWLDTHARDVDPKTRQGYASLVNKWIIPTIGRKRLASLKPSDVLAVREAMSQAGRATSTQRQAHIALGLMLEAARLEGLCRTNVAKDAPKAGGRRGTVVKRERGAFTTEQVGAILAAAARLPLPDASRMWFRILTGARQGEVLGATIPDLHLAPEGEAGSYYVVNWKLEELSRSHGCGDAPCGFKRGAACPNAVWRVPDDFEMLPVEGRLHLTRPKSRTGRVVPLVEPLARILRHHISTTTPSRQGLIWHRDGRPITAGQDSQDWRDLLVSAGVITAEDARPGGTAMTTHWARHTAVTVLMEMTHGDAQLVGEIVGHSSAEVTEMYRHVRGSEREAAMAALASAWEGALAEITA